MLYNVLMEEQALDNSQSDPFAHLVGGRDPDFEMAIERAQEGISSHVHQLDNTVVFLLDNHQDVVLRVRKIDLQYVGETVVDLQVHCRTDFENVLILAKKLKMRISAFATHFTVILKASPEFIAQWSEAILDLDHPAKFFETLDELKRPIFLNLNHYIIARISD